MRLGALNVLIANPRDIDRLRQGPRASTGSTCCPGVNTLYNALAENAEFRKLDFSSLRIANGGGMAVQKAVSRQVARAHRRADHRGLRPLGDFAGRDLQSDRQHRIQRHDRPAVSRAPRSRSSTTPASRCRSARPGEIAIRGPQVMAGYWQRPDETAKVMTPDGFFKSGDIGIMDERGYTSIVDRKKDMIIVSGFNVYPNEIEAVVATHPGVLECAAIGVPDERAGEAVKVFVVRKDPALDRGGRDGVLQAAAHRLQEAEVHRVPRRPAEDQRRQDPAARAAGPQAAAQAKSVAGASSGSVAGDAVPGCRGGDAVTHPWGLARGVHAA